MPAPSPEAPASKAVDQPTSGLGAPVHTALERPTSGVEPPARRPVAQLPTTDMMELYEQLKDEAVQKGVSVSQARGSALGGFLDEATRLGSGLRDEVVAMVEAELRQATASLRHEVGAFLQPRLEQHIASLRVGLEAEDAVPLLACVDTLDEVRAALQDPSAFVHDVLGAALVRAGMARLKPLLLRQASDHGLGAEELNAALDLVDSIEEVRAAMAAPEAFVRRLVEEAVGPAATKLALARLRPLLERRLEQLERRMPWADFEAAIAVLEWGGEWGGVSGAVPGGGRLVQELRDALRTPEAWLDRRLSALLRALEELDSTVDGTVDGTRSTPTVMRRAIGAARAASAVGGARYGASSASNAASSISAMAADAAAQASAGIDGLGRLGTELLDDLSTRLQSLPRRMAEAATAVLQSSLQSSLAMASGTSDMQPSALLKSTMKSLINESLTTLLVEEVTDVFSRALRGLSVELPYAELGAAGAALGEQVHRARWALEQAMAATVHRVEEAARLVEQSVEGLLERVGGALDEAVASAGDLLSELTGEMSNLLSEVSAELPAHVQVVLGFLRPFLVDGAVYLVGAKTPHVAAAHDAQRGERLRREHCDWAVINAPFYHLGERPLLASVSTLVFFAAALWLMGVSYFFVPSTAIDANRTLDGDEIWLIQNQYGRWQEDGTALGNLLFYAALATIPFMLLVGFKFLINHGKLSVCGALIAKLETHYGISVAQVRGYDVQRRKLRRKQPRPQPAGDKRSRVRHGSEEPPPPGEKGGAAEGGRRGDGTDETDARERLGRRAEPIRRVDNFITERTRWNCWLCLITALVSELLVLATFLLFDGRLVQVLGSADAYFGLYMGCHTAVLLVVIIPISLPVAFASFNLMVVQTELLRQNFVAYSGLLDMLCLKVRAATFLAHHLPCPPPSLAPTPPPLRAGRGMPRACACPERAHALSVREHASCNVVSTREPLP